MATIAKLDVLLGLEDGAFQRGLESSRQKLDKWGGNLRSMGTKLTAGVTAPIVGSGFAMVKWAADLEQTMGATEQLWGDNANAIVAWSDTANTSMGLTQNEALTSANRFNALLGDLDDGMGNVADMSMELTERSADLSAMWGGSSIEASDALTSALRGNYEGLDKYNINITGAMVNTEAMRIAVADGRDEITEADKTQARYNLIMEQSSDAQGQFARETDTTSGKLAILRARVIDAATRFGKLLLPYVNKAADAVSKFVGWIEDLNDTQRKWVIGIAAVAAGLGPLLLIIGMLLPGIGALVAVIGFLVSPIGLVVVAVGLLAYVFRDELMTALKYVIEFIGNLVDAWQMLGDGMSPVEKVLRTIQLALAMIGGEDTPGFIAALARAFGELASAFSSGGWMGLLREFGNQILTGLQNLAPLAWQGIQALAQAFWDALPGIMSAGGSMIQGLWDGAVEKWPSVQSWLMGVGGKVLEAIGDMLTTLWQKGVDLIVGLGNGAVAQWVNLSTWLSERGAMVVAAIGALLTTLWQKGVDLFIGLGDGALAQWNNLRTWIANRPAQVVIAVGNVIRTLWQKGVDLFVGLGEGALAQWNNLKTWISNRPTQVVSAVGDVTRTLWHKGVDLFIGLGEGVTTQWGNLKSWLGGMGSRIVDSVGNLGSSLYNAGVAVMQGLWDGLQAKWGDVTSWLSGLNPADWKGPYRRDIKMLYKPGIWIMEGLQNGLAEGWGDVTRQLSGYVPTINAEVTTGARTPSLSGVRGYGGTTVIDNSTHTTEYIALTESDFQQLLAAKDKANALHGQVTLRDGISQFNNRRGAK